MAAQNVRLTCFGVHEATATIDLGRPSTFLAWMAFGFIDPWNGGIFDSDNAVVAEVYSVDGVRVPTSAWGGEHLGQNGALINMHQISHIAYGRRITFRLRAFRPADLEVAADGIVITDINNF